MFSTQPVPKIHYGADGFYYKVGHKRKSNEGADFTTINILPPTNNLSIVNPGQGIEYQFYVQSVNELGEGPVPTIHTAKGSTQSKFVTTNK